MPTAPAPGHTAQLSPVELVAVAGAVKDTAIKKAKAELAENSSTQIDVTLRITGRVAKGKSEPNANGIAPAVVSLDSPAFFCALMRRLKVEPVALRRALKAELKSVQAPADVQQLGQDAATQALMTEIEQAAKQTAARLPGQPWSRAGRAASVTSQIDITVLETPACPASAKASNPAA